MCLKILSYIIAFQNLKYLFGIINLLLTPCRFVCQGATQGALKKTTMLGPITSLLFIHVRHFYCVASISNRLFILDNINLYYWLLIIIITKLQYWLSFFQFWCILFRKNLKDIRKDGVFTTVWNSGNRFVLNFFMNICQFQLSNQLSFLFIHSYMCLYTILSLSLLW